MLVKFTLKTSFYFNYGTIMIVSVIYPYSLLINVLVWQWLFIKIFMLKDEYK